jgi:hypothetical protein
MHFIIGKTTAFPYYHVSFLLYSWWITTTVIISQCQHPHFLLIPCCSAATGFAEERC